MSISDHTPGLRAARAEGRSSLPTPHHSLITRAFTLIELLVVMAIITVVVAIGIPLFGALTGAKSVEAGRNIVAATIGAARTAAVNEGKYAGVLFYVDPATERTAMTVVIVSDPVSGLEDPDPYDKYKSFYPQQDYKAPAVDANGVPVRGDRVIALTSDSDATFKGSLYAPSRGSNTTSNYLDYFGNYRPTVRAFRCTTDNNGQNTKGVRPPQNGPSPTLPDQTKTLPSYNRTAVPASAAESKFQGFANDNWNAELDKGVTRYSTAEQTLLPVGVGLQVIIQPLDIPNTSPVRSERYLRTGVIMFDPQGRLVQRAFSLGSKDPLGEYLLLGQDAPNIQSGLGIVLYDVAQFRGDSSRTEADAIYSQASPSMYTITSSNPALAGPIVPTSEVTEELWLDNNTTPLLINRYSGSMSETD